MQTGGGGIAFPLRLAVLDLSDARGKWELEQRRDQSCWHQLWCHAFFAEIQSHGCTVTAKINPVILADNLTVLKSGIIQLASWHYIILFSFPNYITFWIRWNINSCENLTDDIKVYHKAQISVEKSLLIHLIMSCLAELYPDQSVNNNKANE